MKVCHACLRDSAAIFCKKCQKELFGGIAVEKLDFTPDRLEPIEEARYRQGLSISGVQRKYSFAFDDTKKLAMVERNGRYIVKPAPNVKYEFVEDMPANEHLSMQLAKQVFGLEVALNGLVPMADGKLAYITKRFDYREDGTKIDQEDFASLTGATEETKGKNFKYDFSLQECVTDVIEKHTAAPAIHRAVFFKKILFDYLISNGDSHLKNFSLYNPTGSATGRYLPTPFYDLLNTRLHLGTQELTDIALDLFADGETTATFDALGFCSRRDFEEFARTIGLSDAVTANIFRQFERSQEKIKALIGRSFLGKEAKKICLGHLEARLRQRILYVPGHF